MYVLRQMVDAVKPAGLVLDLQVIRPNPRVEVDGSFVCELDGEPLFAKADAATAAVNALLANGELVEELVYDHDVLKHYANGADLADDWERSERRPLNEPLPGLHAIARPCVTRERCRLRRLRVRHPAPSHSHPAHPHQRERRFRGSAQPKVCEFPPFLLARARAIIAMGSGSRVEVRSRRFVAETRQGPLAASSSRRCCAGSISATPAALVLIEASTLAQ